MSYVRNPLVYNWLFLTIATILSWWLGMENDSKPHHQASVWVTVAILLIAMIKCRVVMRSYMEVRLAPNWLRLTCDAWLMINFGMLSALYWSRLAS